MIPRQLKDYRFIKTFRKNAREVAWPIDPVRFKQNSDDSYTDNITGMIYKSKGKIYKGELKSYSYDQMQSILEDEKPLNNHTLTYGVLGGFNGLVVVDLDNAELAEKLKNIWPFSDTFSTLSGTKKLPHFYFKCEEYSKVTRFDGSNNKRLMDVQGRSSYVIGPNSFMKSNNQRQIYEVYNNVEIIDISYEELISIIDENIGESHKIQKKEKNVFTDSYYTLDPISQYIFKKIHCDTILEEFGIDTTNNPGDTPFADSEGKACLHRTEHLWFDHHTQQGGNVIQLYAKIYNIDIIKAKYDLAEQSGITEAMMKQSLQFFLKNKSHELTELLAIRWMTGNKTYTIRNDSQKRNEVFIYKGGIYIPNGESYIKEFIDNFLGDWYTSGVANKIMDKIVVRSQIDSEEFFKGEDTDFIPVENGILNIFTKELSEFTPEKIFFNKLPVKFNPNNTCETTVKHFETVLNGTEDTLVMQELYGYLLYRNYEIQKAFMFYGKGGNGKSITIEQMKCLIGDHNSINLSLQQLQNEKFMRGELHNKLANLADDIGQAKLEETQIFKEITGSSTITVDRKFLSTMSFKSHAKQVFSANTLPEFGEDTDAIWRRWIMLGFNKKFIPRKEYEKLLSSCALKPNHRIQDVEVIKKLTTPEELSGVLNWALNGLARLMENKDFSSANSHEEVRNIWRRNASPVVAFFQDSIEVTRHPDDWEEHENLYDKYIEYCATNKVRVIENIRQFKKRLQDEHLICVRKTVAVGKEYRWQGIRLKR